MQRAAREEKGGGGREHRQRGDGAHRADGSEQPIEALAEEAEERVRPEVRGEHEEPLLERRRREPVAHRDEARVRRQILEGQRV